MEIQIVGAQFPGIAGEICIPILDILRDVPYCPTKESISLAGRRIGDRHAFVDFQILIVLFIVDDIVRIEVIVGPVDRLSRSVYSVNIFRPQLHRVRIGAASLQLMGIIRLDLEGLSMEDLDDLAFGVGSIHKCSAVPHLHYPVGELLSGLGGIVRRDNSLSAIDIV